jgi:DNA-binding MurR/RpiR family transcriptional regulator
VTARLSEVYGELSPGHRRVADFILSSPHEAALMTLHRLSQETGVSVPTVNRLGKRLGLGGYSDLKRSLQSELRAALRPLDEFAQEMRVPQATAQTPWRISIEQDGERLRSIHAVGGDAAFARACAQLASARRVGIVGLGSSAFLAQYAAYCLASLRDGCEALIDGSGGEGLSRKLLEFGAEDVVLELVFARYSREAGSIARQLKDLRIPLLLVTDADTAPGAALADECFIVPRTAGVVLTGSGTGGMAVIEALLRGTAAAIGVDTVQRRLARLTTLLGGRIVPADSDGRE